MSYRVKTKNASYIVDPVENRWMRISATDPRFDDGEWVEGGFTRGEVGEACFAHFANHPDGATGRRTSTVLSIHEADA